MDDLEQMRSRGGVVAAAEDECGSYLEQRRTGEEHEHGELGEEHEHGERATCQCH